MAGKQNDKPESKEKTDDQKHMEKSQHKKTAEADYAQHPKFAKFKKGSKSL